MTEPPKKPQTAASRRASSEVLANQRDKVVREQLEKERAASTAKTAKLRALRLAKEEEDRRAEQKPDADNSSSKDKFRIIRPRRVQGHEPT